MKRKELKNITRKEKGNTARKNMCLHMPSGEEGSCSSWIGKAGRATRAYGKEGKGRDTLSSDQLWSCSEIAHRHCRGACTLHGDTARGSGQLQEPRPFFSCPDPVPPVRKRQKAGGIQLLCCQPHTAESKMFGPVLQAVNSIQLVEKSRTLSSRFIHLRAEARISVSQQGMLSA